jgi:hypothetical protein
MSADLCTYAKIWFDTKNIESIEKGELFLYVFSHRIKLLLLLILFSLTFVRKILHGIMILLAGVRYSVLISALTVLNENKTILNFMELVVPQDIFYILSCLMMFSLSWDFEGEEWRLHHASKKISGIIGMVIVYLLGIVTEVYINPCFLKFLSH